MPHREVTAAALGRDLAEQLQGVSYRFGLLVRQRCLSEKLLRMASYLPGIPLPMGLRWMMQSRRLNDFLRWGQPDETWQTFVAVIEQLFVVHFLEISLEPGIVRLTRSTPTGPTTQCTRPSTVGGLVPFHQVC